MLVCYVIFFTTCSVHSRKGATPGYVYYDDDTLMRLHVQHRILNYCVKRGTVDCSFIFNITIWNVNYRKGTRLRPTGARRLYVVYETFLFCVIRLHTGVLLVMYVR